MLCRNTEKWLYRLDRDYTWNCAKTIPEDMSFRDQKGKVRLILKQNGDIMVTARYAWDGCTPKLCFLDVLIGIPDGAVDTGTGRPKTYYASLVHDALYQFLHDGLPYTRKDADRFFLQLMKETDFALRGLYYVAVRIFGHIFHWLSARFGKKRKTTPSSQQQESWK